VKGTPTVTADDARLSFCPACDIELAAGAASCPRCGEAAVSIRAGVDPNLGRVLDGRYEIRSLLGAGGMGTVYRAWQRSVEREVAIKLMSERYRRDLTWIRRFLREARLTSRLQHPHTVGIVDFGQSGDGDLFLAMELLEGKTLLDVLHRDGAFDVERTVRLGVQICDALSAAHGAQIIHRDLKPQNIMLLAEPAPRDFVKLLDFGLARALGGDELDATHGTQLVGTPYYMAPELRASAPASAASDLYAVGVILCEAHLGRSLFGSDSFAGLQLEKAALVDVPEAIDPRLRGVLRDLVEPDPARRAQSAAEVRARLELCLADGAIAAPRRSPPTTSRPRETISLTVDSVVTADAPPRRRRTAALVAGAVAIAAAASAAALWLGDGDPPATATLSAPMPAAGEPTVEVLASEPAAPDQATPSAPAGAAPARGYGCGPNLVTYAVEGGDGVRCVAFAHGRGGGRRLAWYGEGTRRDRRYRHVGEGALGAAASAVDLHGNGEDDDDRIDGGLTLRAAGGEVDGAPARIAVGGAWRETWVRTDGLHAGYTSVFTEPITTCGRHFDRYRVFHTDEWKYGFSVRCVLPGGRTWIGTGHWRGQPYVHVGTWSFEDGRWGPIAGDLCADPTWICVAADHGSLSLERHAFAGIGAGFVQAGQWPEIWLPSRRRHALRLWIERVAPDGGAPAPSVDELRRWVDRANQRLAAADVELFFVDDQPRHDLVTFAESALGRAAADPAQWTQHREVVTAAHPGKLVVFLRDGAGCAAETTPGYVTLSPVDTGCDAPAAERFAAGVARYLGLGDAAGQPTAAEAERLTAWLRAQRLE